jgi:hypothetical protein
VNSAVSRVTSRTPTLIITQRSVNTLPREAVTSRNRQACATTVARQSVNAASRNRRVRAAPSDRQCVGRNTWQQYLVSVDEQQGVLYVVRAEPNKEQRTLFSEQWGLNPLRVTSEDWASYEWLVSELLQREYPASCSLAFAGVNDSRVSNCDTADGSNCEIVNCVSVRANVQ